MQLVTIANLFQFEVAQKWQRRQIYLLRENSIVSLKMRCTRQGDY